MAESVSSLYHAELNTIMYTWKCTRSEFFKTLVHYCLLLFTIGNIWFPIYICNLLYNNKHWKCADLSRACYLRQYYVHIKADTTTPVVFHKPVTHASITCMLIVVFFFSISLQH